MINALFDSKGLPLAVSCPDFFAQTLIKPKMLYEKVEDKFLVDGLEFVCWGDTNRSPDDSTAIIGRTGVLQTAIGFKVRTSFGQGVVARKHQGYDEDGDEVMVPFTDDPKVQQYLDSPSFRNYSAQALRDLFKFGNAFPVFYFNEQGKIVRVICRNARHCRLSRDKTKLLVYPDFANTQPGDKREYEIIEMLNEEDPLTDLMIRKATGRLKSSKPIAYPRLQNYFSNNDYYGAPDWLAAYEAGWIDIANFVPNFLKQSYANALTMMWHMQIPRRWYEKKFPESNYISEGGGGYQKREDDIRNFFKDLEQSLSGKEGGKSLLTEYGDEEGLGEDKWIIERLDNEIDSKERLNTSAAANSEILFSMMINPSTLGAGMPGGSYAGNSGSGSDIRESYLVSVITTYIEKQQVLDPVRTMLVFNGASEELRLKYKETILTTLNTGNSVATETT